MISIFTGSLGLCVAALIVFLMRRDRLHASHGMSWVVIAVCFALLGFAPGIVDAVAKYTGVSYPPVLALTLAIALLVIKILFMDIERSHIEMRNQRLVQRMAMLEADLRTGLEAMEKREGQFTQDKMSGIDNDGEEQTL
ncbi:MAG: hypothetical protein ACJASY_000954 [Halioglobus sp.]|jgi:hypothetical protein